MTPNEKAINNFEIKTINQISGCQSLYVADNLQENPLCLPLVKQSPESRTHRIRKFKSRLQQNSTNDRPDRSSVISPDFVGMSGNYYRSSTDNNQLSDAQRYRERNTRSSLM